MSMQILPQNRARESLTEILATTRYAPETQVPKDENGLPIVEVDPDDPDDE